MMLMREQFDRCWPWLEASIECYGHTHTKEDIWRLIEKGYVDFWPGEASAWITEFWHHPTGLRTFHVWLAGGDLAEIMARSLELEQFARDHGAQRSIVSARKGWIRVAPPGYREISRRIMKVLINDPRLPWQQETV
jgi:hypothetical protein